MRRLIALTAFAFVAATSAAPAQDAAAGKKVFARCGACHAVGAGAKNKVGPELNGVVGRVPGSVEGFKYSPAMVEYGKAHVWDAATLDAYLENPKGAVPGNKMAFAGLKKPEERANVLAYLATFNADGSAAAPTQ
jgi:cytochrome c